MAHAPPSKCATFGDRGGIPASRRQRRTDPPGEGSPLNTNHKARIFAQVHAGGEKYCCLVDTGSAVTLVGEQLANRLGLTIDDSATMDIVSVTGEPVGILGTSRMPITWGPCTEEVVVHVSASTRHDILIGDNMMRKYNVSIEYSKARRPRIYIDGEMQTTFSEELPSDGELGEVALSEPLVIPPLSTLWVPCAITPGSQPLTDPTAMMEVHATPDRELPPNVTVQQTVVAASATSIVLPIYNLGIEEVTLQPRRVVAVCSMVAQDSPLQARIRQLQAANDQWNDWASSGKAPPDLYPKGVAPLNKPVSSLEELHDLIHQGIPDEEIPDDWFYNLSWTWPT